MANELRQDERESYEEQPREANEMLQGVLAMAPSWLGSAIIHIVVILLLAQVPWQISPQEDKVWQADIVNKVDDVKKEELPPEKPVVEDPDADLSDLPPADVAYVPEVEMEQTEMDVPGFNVLEPEKDPPLAIAKLALGDQGASGHFHGIYGSRGGRGRSASSMRYGGNPLAEKGVMDALGWLARVQESDGRWDSVKWGANHNCDAGLTGLALLAFLGHGDTDRDEGKYRLTVAKALEWLEKRGGGNGSFGERFYTQGICTMAVSEAYGMTKNPRWASLAQKALDFLCANQNANGGWDYGGNNPGRVDTSVTGWCVMALKSGVASGLNVPEASIVAIKKWITESVNADGTTGYTKNIGAQGSTGGTPPMTSVATLARQFMGWKRDSEELQKGLDYIAKAGPSVGANANLYYTYYGTLVMFQAQGEYWMNWNKAFRDPLIDRQVKNRGPQLDGSWDTDDTYGAHGGRVYTTAMAVFCLEVYYRFMPIFK